METIRFETQDLTLEFIADLKQRFKNNVFELNVFTKDLSTDLETQLTNNLRNGFEYIKKVKTGEIQAQSFAVAMEELKNFVTK